MDYINKPELLLQKLIRFQTISPAGNELEIMKFVEELFKANGFEVESYCLDKSRPNVMVTYKGESSENPLLFYGHLDVVGVEGQDWEIDPFEGVIKDGFVHGRGTLDMKGLIVMFASAILQLKQTGFVPKQDIKLLFLSDEEADSTYGAKFLVDNKPEIFNNIKYAIGEMGAFPNWIEGKKLYPIMITEKQVATIKLTARSSGGHGSLKASENSALKLSQALINIDKIKFKHTVTPGVKMMVESIADAIGGIKGKIVKLLLNKYFAKSIIKLLGSSGSVFEVLLYNSFNITMIEAGKNINVIPSVSSAYLDVRLLPGEGIEDFVELLKQKCADIEFEIVVFDENQGEIDLKYFETLSKIITDRVSDAIPIPLVFTAVTDGRFLSNLGIQTYGFTPMNYDESFDPIALIHNGNEKIPVDSLYFGVECVKELIKVYK